LTDDRGNVLKNYGPTLKVKRKDTFGIPPLLHDGSTYSDSLAKANNFNNYFASIFTEEDCSTIPTHGSQPLSTIISPLTTSVEGVAHLLQKIDPNKTGGPDGISARFLKELSLEIASVLT